MSLAKIVCLALATGCVFWAWTPPVHRPAVNEVKLTKRRSEKFLVSTGRGFRWPFTLLLVLELLVALLDHQGNYNAVFRSIVAKMFFSSKLRGIPDTDDNIDIDIPITSPHLEPSLQFFFGVALILSAITLRYHCYQTLGRHYTLEVAILKDHQLVTSGPYGVVRHPGYASSVLLTLGVFAAISAKGSWVRESGVLETYVGQMVGIIYLVFCCATVTSLMWRVPKEEKVLRKEFGKQWVEWKNRVPWKVIPGIY
ncbi:hypothetical protein D9758_008258 [Tetrapyrgos nigripes]|uniref:Protein-S-isoprenylcysteine O-methyltransferase n=1 Tax=Tetrapyrgos nigripes TaxID=182062 RepID=A0A8H5G1E0_9AGAR|nr:hypothetical protein D9758_008258 [Tetrapyrgos nigripes]